MRETSSSWSASRWWRRAFRTLPGRHDRSMSPVDVRSPEVFRGRAFRTSPCPLTGSITCDVKLRDRIVQLRRLIIDRAPLMLGGLPLSGSSGRCAAAERWYADPLGVGSVLFPLFPFLHGDETGIAPRSTLSFRLQSLQSAARIMSATLSASSGGSTRVPSVDVGLGELSVRVTSGTFVSEPVVLPRPNPLDAAFERRHQYHVIGAVEAGCTEERRQEPPPDHTVLYRHRSRRRCTAQRRRQPLG